MNKFYYARHGQTEWNLERKVCGRSDIPLTETGRKQALDLADKVKKSDLHITKIITSPLKRAVETAKIISNINSIPVTADFRITERNFGKAEGTEYSDEFKLSVKQLAYNFETGENAFQVAERIFEVLDEISRSSDTYLMVAHNGLARFVHSYFNGRDIKKSEDFFIKNSEIKEYKFK